MGLKIALTFGHTSSHCCIRCNGEKNIPLNFFSFLKRWLWMTIQWRLDHCCFKANTLTCGTTICLMSSKKMWSNKESVKIPWSSYIPNLLMNKRRTSVKGLCFRINNDVLQKLFKNFQCIFKKKLNLT